MLGKLIIEKKVFKNEQGSLSLEQVLYIGAVVAISAGLFAFYGNISDYLSNVGFSDAPSNIGATNSANNS